MARKAKINGDTRRLLAKKLGCHPGETINTSCKICNLTGTVEWRMGVSGRGKGQIIFSPFEIDHIKPESLGGSSKISNLQLLCQKCNRTKGFKVQGVNNG